jgi:hypothetical protein
MLMPIELQKLAKALAEIRKDRPAHGKRYSTIVENPFESGYWLPAKLSKQARIGVQKKRLAVTAGASR